MLNKWKQKEKSLTVSMEEAAEGCWPVCWTAVTAAALWLPEGNQGCPAIGATGACIWEIGWNCDTELALFCGWTKEAGANWNKQNYVNKQKKRIIYFTKICKPCILKQYSSSLTEYAEEKGIPAAPGTWLVKGGAGCWDCGGPGAVGLDWMYDIDKLCDEGIGWPAWPGLGGYGCIGWEKCSGWLWAPGITKLGGGIPCPTGWNCCEADGRNGCPWFGIIGRNYSRRIRTNSNQQKLFPKRDRKGQQTWTGKKLLVQIVNQNFEIPMKQLQEAEMANPHIVGQEETKSFK